MRKMNDSTLVKLRGHHIYTYAAYILGFHSLEIDEDDRKQMGYEKGLFAQMHQNPNMKVKIVANEPDAICDLKQSDGKYVCTKRRQGCFGAEAEEKDADAVDAKDAGFKIGGTYTVAELERRIRKLEAKEGYFRETNDILNEAIKGLEEKPKDKRDRRPEAGTESTL